MGKLLRIVNMAQGYKVKDKYELGPKIGEGMFGKVKEAVDEDGSRYAVKIIAKAAMVGRSNKEVENLQKEVAYMRTLNGHKNVLRLIDIHEDSDNLYLVLELAKGGDLFDKIVGDGWGLSIKPTAQFVSELPETDIAARLEDWFMANGAECVTVGDEEECVVGTHVKVCFSPKPQGKLPLEVVFGLSTSESRTSITIRRTKGDCMHYIEAYRSIISPGIVACLE